MSEDKESCTLYTRPFPTLLRLEFRAYCARNDLKMHEEVARAIRQYLQSKGQKVKG